MVQFYMSLSHMKYNKLFSICTLLYNLMLRPYIRPSNHYMFYIFISLFMFLLDSLWVILHGTVMWIGNLAQTGKLSTGMIRDEGGRLGQTIPILSS
jgi:predicted CDP-diglyceride synthetase/phosphatidate cytidylyltransferase